MGIIHILGGAVVQPRVSVPDETVAVAIAARPVGATARHMRLGPPLDLWV